MNDILNIHDKMKEIAEFYKKWTSMYIKTFVQDINTRWKYNYGNLAKVQPNTSKTLKEISRTIWKT